MFFRNVAFNNKKGNNILVNMVFENVGNDIEYYRHAQINTYMQLLCLLIFKFSYVYNIILSLFPNRNMHIYINVSY